MARIPLQAIAPRDRFEALSNSRFWLRQLVGGLPPEFEYDVVRSVADAKTLILVLPNCDRGRAAVGLYRHRQLIGADAAYSGIMVAWDHDHREIVDAFGSPEQFITALKEVAPPVNLRSSKPVEVWRGAVVNRRDSLRHSVGLSWTRSRNVACWFALHDYVPALQPSLAPVVLHANLDPSAIVARHDVRAEQEVIVDVNRLLRTASMIALDGLDISLGESQIRVGDLDPDGAAIDQLITQWRRAAGRYERWKGLMELRRRLALRCGQGRHQVR